MNYLQLLKLAAPETIVVLTALAVLTIDLTSLRDVERRTRFIIGGMIACLGCAVAVAWMLISHSHTSALGGLLVVDPVTQFVKIGVLALTIFTVALSMDSDFTTHVGEYLALVLLASVGMMFLISSEDLLMIFLSLELTSLSLYILAAFNKRDVKSAEAALKYFLFGGMAAAFTLFGLSLIYGLTGSTSLQGIAKAVGEKTIRLVVSADGSVASTLDPLFVVAMVMVIVGFGFKVAAVPFHLWAPDAYQGAPTPSAALIASGSKVASFFIFAKVMMIGFAGKGLEMIEGRGALFHFVPGWVPVVAVTAVLSMLLGNLAAIVQSSVRRLIAYSAIAHAGYMLLGVMSHSRDSMAALIYYAVTYGLTTVGAFGVVAVVERGTGGDKLSDFAGLSRRAPVVSFCMMIFMLSLAGIPPLSGFFGKFYLFAAALKTGAPDLGLLWLVILAIAMSAVSLYYYLQVLKKIYVADPPEEGRAEKIPVLSQVVLSLLAIGVVVFGCAPSLILNPLQRALELAGF